MSVWYDRGMTCGLGGLILLTPLAFGSVHPWAFAAMEALIFLLLGVWLGKLWALNRDPRVFPAAVVRSVRCIALPLGLFLALLGFQLLPLPPALIQLLSPSTYEVYTRSLPGWPEQLPYTRVEEEAPEQPLSAPETALSPISLQHWRPLSLAPVLSKTDLLKFLAYTGLLLCLVLYPWGTPEDRVTRPGVAEERFFRRTLGLVLVSGLLISSIGLIQHFTWNGKILWFFVPYDWGTSPLGDLLPRASGPFINPDHFANYLALIAPLAVVGMLSPGLLSMPEHTRAVRLFSGVVLFALAAGILLSLSRSMWLATGLGLGWLLWMLPAAAPGRRTRLLPWRGKASWWFALGAFLVGLLLVMLVGPSARNQLDLRLAETVADNAGMGGRLALWADVLRIVWDFPVFGVGLGAWTEVFPRYQPPPWTTYFYREVHNDYLELLSETGVLGFGLLAWFFWRTGKRLLKGWPTLTAQTLPVGLAVLSGLAIMAFHAGLDFSLQMPANAVLFTIFLALMFRLVSRGEPVELAVPVTSAAPDLAARPLARFAVLGLGGLAVGLVVLALSQERLPYPYRLTHAVSAAQVHDLLSLYPAHAGLHVARCRVLHDTLSLAEQQTELEIALWLDPRNPSIRDLYVASLFQAGKEEHALQHLTRSVFFSPHPATHRYLDRQLIPWLSDREQKAIEEGLQQARVQGNETAFIGLGDFYTALGRFAERAALYADVAKRQARPSLRSKYLAQAGLASVQAGEERQALNFFRQAIRLSPADPQPYSYLVSHIFASRHDLEGAKAVVAEGIRNGADPFALSIALADAAQQGGAWEIARQALRYAVAVRPSSADAHLRLGRVYLQEKNYDRAVLSLRKALALDPQSALAFYSLGMAEEGRYKFFPAKQAYIRAVELDPTKTGWQQHYQRFLQKLEHRES